MPRQTDRTLSALGEHFLPGHENTVGSDSALVRMSVFGFESLCTNLT